MIELICPRTKWDLLRRDLILDEILLLYLSAFGTLEFVDWHRSNLGDDGFHEVDIRRTVLSDSPRGLDMEAVVLLDDHQ